VCIGYFGGEMNFYCSSGCKKACPTFGVDWKEKEYKPATSREANALLRKLVLNRDNHQCTKCGAKGKKIELHCHHVMPATQNPMLANDPDNCVTLCKGCHKEIHQTKGCGYHELRCG
jgi:5-methylcytosine-specific restriction endonuclease McrA